MAVSRMVLQKMSGECGMSNGEENRRGDDPKIDSMSAMIGGMSQKVDHLATTMDTLAITMTDNHDATIKYRATVGARIDTIAAVVDSHSEIVSYINPAYLPTINRTLEHARKAADTSDWWAVWRQNIIADGARKGVWILIIVAIVGLLYGSGFENVAKKLADLIT